MYDQQSDHTSVPTGTDSARPMTPDCPPRECDEMPMPARPDDSTCCPTCGCAMQDGCCADCDMEGCADR